MSTKSDHRRRAVLVLVAVLASGWTGCADPAPEPEATDAESWSVTAWGERFEVFPEVEPLVAGEVAVAHTHVTRLDGFTPLVEGTVEVVLAGPSGEEVFRAEEPVRPGIFAVEIEPRSPGEADLLFRIRDGAGTEEIRGGRVRVREAGGSDGAATLLRAPAPKGATAGGEPLPFLKEEQWRSEFGTAWVSAGRLAGSVAGLARVRPPAGGEVSVTAPVDGALRPGTGVPSWPYVGMAVDRGSALFRVIPHVAADRSLAVLEAEVSSADAELGAARARLSRLEELLDLGAVSRREAEEARVRVETLEARRAAAARDLEGARSSREGGVSGGFTLRAPLAGEVAEVSTSPGATVAAGEALARIVRTDVVWLEIALPPAGARRLAEQGIRGVVLSDPEGPPVRIEEGLRLVSVAPELSPRTGTVTVLLEAPPSAGLSLGTTLEAQVLSTRDREGVVIPSSALVDDGGVPVVYLQLSGESFARQPVHIVERQGDLLLVDHLTPGQRLVTRGGDAIRRSSLMASGQAHGHVH